MDEYSKLLWIIEKLKRIPSIFDEEHLQTHAEMTWWLKELNRVSCKRHRDLPVKGFKISVLSYQERFGARVLCHELLDAVLYVQTNIFYMNAKRLRR